MARIAKIEGIGDVYAQKLREAGVQTVDDLLKAGADPQGRNELAEKTGISGKLILEWVNHADLFRIKGVGEEYSDLLEEAGVDTVPELAQTECGEPLRQAGRDQPGERTGAQAAHPGPGKRLGGAGQGLAPGHQLLDPAGQR